MEVRAVMSESVVTASGDTPVREVAALMRERNVGSVIILAADGSIAGFVTDRDLAVSVVADARPADDPVSAHASSPVVTGDPSLDVRAAAELMIANGVRRLPILDSGRLTGIVTLDDLAMRVGDLELAASITAQVTRAALPGFYFHTRGE